MINDRTKLARTGNCETRPNGRAMSFTQNECRSSDCLSSLQLPSRIEPDKSQSENFSSRHILDSAGSCSFRWQVANLIADSVSRYWAT